MERRDLQRRIAALEKTMHRPSPTAITDNELIGVLSSRKATPKHVRRLFMLMGEELRATVLVSAEALRNDPKRLVGTPVQPMDLAITIVSYPADEAVPDPYEKSVFMSCGYSPDTWTGVTAFSTSAGSTRGYGPSWSDSCSAAIDGTRITIAPRCLRRRFRSLCGTIFPFLRVTSCYVCTPFTITSTPTMRPSFVAGFLGGTSIP